MRSHKGSPHRQGGVSTEVGRARGQSSPSAASLGGLAQLLGRPLPLALLASATTNLIHYVNFTQNNENGNSTAKYMVWRTSLDMKWTCATNFGKMVILVNGKNGDFTIK